MQLFWKDKSILPDNSKKTIGEIPLFPGTVALTVSCGPPGEMFQGFPGDIDSGSRGSSSPSIESQYLSSVDSFGSPLAPQECVSAGGVFSSVGSEPGGDMGGGEMPGSFVPTVTAITTSQDLQWMVQPTLVSSQASGHSGTTGTSMMSVTQPVSLSLLDPYDMPGPSYSSGSAFSPPGSETQGPAPGPIRQSRARGRRAREESVSDDGDVGVLLTPEEEAKRHVRRERNKLAAAKCRNRRKELTDRLQSETDDLEEEKAELEAEISELQKEKERLEFVLVTHQPGCKIPYHEEDQPPQLGSSVQQQLPALRPPQAGLLLQQQQQTTTPISIVGLTVKEDTSFYLPPAYTPRLPASSSQQQQQQQEGLMQQEVAFSTSFYGSGELGLMGSGDSGGGAGGYNNNPSYTSSFLFTCPPAEGACGASAHQRNSSSEQSSSDNSLNSPSLLAL